MIREQKEKGWGERKRKLYHNHKHNHKGMETNHQNTVSGRPNSSHPVESISKQTQRGLHLLRILPKQQKANPRKSDWPQVRTQGGQTGSFLEEERFQGLV